MTVPDKVRAFKTPAEALANASAFVVLEELDTRLLHVGFGEYADGRGFYWSMDFGSSWISGKRSEGSPPPSQDELDRRVKTVSESFSEWMLDYWRDTS